jgi:hypothetical protein
MPAENTGSGSRGKSGVNPGVIAGPVVAVVVLGALTVGLWWLWKRKKVSDPPALDVTLDTVY